MMSATTKCAAFVFAAGLALPALAADGDWARVGEALGKSGTEMPGDIYRIGLPRTDLKVTLDGVDNTDPNFNTYVIQPSIDA